jgi:CheY-like chemotaxis protein
MQHQAVDSTFDRRRRRAASSGGGDSKPAGTAIVDALPPYVLKAANPRHVLIIEDNLDSVHTLTLLLRDMGHLVDYAINGYVGLDIARRMQPDFIFLDIGLPGMNGFEVCKRVKADPALANTKVVIITGYTDDLHRERSRLAGCDMHLVKPVPIRVIQALLE